MNYIEIKSLIKKFIKKIPFFNELGRNYLNNRRKQKFFKGPIYIQQKDLVQKIKKKPIIKVAFIVLHHSVWKYDELYRLLENDPLFEPIIVACPVVNHGDEYMSDNLSQTYSHFKQNYNALNSLKDNGDWIDINLELNPDIVFFTNPHKLTSSLYQIDSFYNSLTCYTPYAFVVIHLLNLHYNYEFHAKLWKHFVETKTHKKFAECLYPERSSNVVNSGFPGLDQIYNIDYSPKNVWKKVQAETIKIIWAPHHTIDDDTEFLAMSNFLEYAFFFQECIAQNKNIQIAFKPHPLLKPKLYLHEKWGAKKTDEYYQSWDLLDNGQLETGEYIDLFSQSDALILDSASFMVEYLYFGKPLLFMQRDPLVKERLNEFGQLVLKQLCTSNNETELIAFIDDVKNGKDTNKKKREDFFNKEIKIHKITSSEYIYNVLKNELS
tara:strand:+ start:51 stop:1358 length:1308 start_codon:yes stop_codon:yes gene_type:complete